MSQFAYQAKDNDRKVVSGTIEADSENAAIARLGAQGLFPIEISEIGAHAEASRKIFGGGRINSRTLAYMTRQLSDLIGGGLPLLSALNVLAKQTEHPRLKGIVEKLSSAVRDGRALSDSLAEYPQVFNQLYVSMVRAGEVSGGLERVLEELADLGESEAELRSRVIAASVYPILVMCVAIGMTIFMLAFVIPKLSLVFIESGQALPMPTRILLSISDLFRHWWWLMIGGMGIGIWSLIRWRKSDVGSVVMDRIMLTIPGVGDLVRQINTARFARNLGVMLGQGVPVLQALQVVADNVSNFFIRKAVQKSREAVREGASIAGALSETKEFPVFVSNMVAVGEESGKVDKSLIKVATTIEREVDRTMRTLTSIIEPVLLLVVGAIVLFIVLAMLLPIFQIGLITQ